MPRTDRKTPSVREDADTSPGSPGEAEERVVAEWLTCCRRVLRGVRGDA